jgi:hypothetical protein
MPVDERFADDEAVFRLPNLLTTGTSSLLKKAYRHLATQDGLPIRPTA